MKKTPKTIFIFLLVIFLFLFILLPVISFFAIFHDTWLSDEFKQRRAEISAEKYEEQAIEDATSYLEDHFENLDEDDIVDVMWAPHAPNVWGIDGLALIKDMLIMRI